MITIIPDIHGRVFCKKAVDSIVHDITNESTLENFRNNWKLFRMAWETTIRGRRYVFSHAGLSIEWMNEHVEGGILVPGL